MSNPTPDPTQTVPDAPPMDAPPLPPPMGNPPPLPPTGKPPVKKTPPSKPSGGSPSPQPPQPQPVAPVVVAPPAPIVIAVRHDEFEHPPLRAKPAAPTVAVIVQPDDQQAQQLAPVSHGASRVAIIARARSSQSFNDGVGHRDAPVTEVMGYTLGLDKPRIAWRVKKPDKIATVKFELRSRTDKTKVLWQLEWTGGDVQTKLVKDPWKQAKGGKVVSDVDQGIDWTGTLDLGAIAIDKTLKLGKDTDPSFPDGVPTIAHSPYRLSLTVTSKGATEDERKLLYPGVAWTYFQVDPLPFENLVRQKAVKDYWAYVPQFEARLGYWVAIHPKAMEGADKLIGKLKALVRPDRDGFEARFVDLFNYKSTERDPKPYRGCTGAPKNKYKDMDIAFREGNLREKMGLLYMAYTSGEFKKTLRQVFQSKDRGDQALIDRAYTQQQKDVLKYDKTSGTDFFQRTAFWSKWSGPECKGRNDKITPNLKVEQFTPENNQVPLNYRELKGALGDPKTKGTAGFLHLNYLWGQRGEWSKVPEDERRLIIVDEFIGKTMPWGPGKEWVFVVEGGPYGNWTKQILVYPLAGLSGTTDMYAHGGMYLGLGAAELRLVRLAAIGSMIPAGDHSFFEIMMGAREYLGPTSFLTDTDTEGWKQYEFLAPELPIADIEKNVGKLPGTFFSREHLKKLSDHFHESAFSFLELPDAGLPFDHDKPLGSAMVKLNEKKIADIWSAWDAKNAIKVVVEKPAPPKQSRHTLEQRSHVSDAEKDPVFKSVMKLVKKAEDTDEAPMKYAALVAVISLVDKYMREKAGATDVQAAQVKRIFTDLRPYYHDKLTELDGENPVPLFFYLADGAGELNGSVASGIASLTKTVGGASWKNLSALADARLDTAKKGNQKILRDIIKSSTFKDLANQVGLSEAHMILAALIYSVVDESAVLEDMSFKMEQTDSKGTVVASRTVTYASLAKHVNALRYNYQLDDAGIVNLLDVEGSDSFVAKNYVSHGGGANDDIEKNLGGVKPINWGGKTPDAPDSNKPFRLEAVQAELEAARALHALEKAGIGHYSGGAYVQYTGWDLPEDNVIAYQAAVISGLHKLPRFTGACYRGAAARSPGRLPAIGSISTSHCLKSTTYRLRGSFSAGSSKGNYIFYTRNGARIDYVAMKPWEYEVLIAPGTRFKIIGVHDMRLTKNGKLVKPSDDDMSKITVDTAKLTLVSSRPDGLGGMPPGIGFDDPRVNDPQNGDAWKAWYRDCFAYKYWEIAEEV